MVSDPTVRLATWNTQWLAPGSRRRTTALAEIRSWAADVAVLTEVDRRALEPLGRHVATGGTDWGYPRSGDRYKVVLLSVEPWRDIDVVGDAGLPPGRFVAATTMTSLGDVRVLGVCVPWRDAHVRTGTRASRPWEEHVRYLAVLEDVVARSSGAEALVIAGDLNQAFDARSPVEARTAMEAAFSGCHIVTRASSCGRRLLDHVAIGRGLMATDVRIRCLAHGNPALSDHDAAWVQLRPASRGGPGPL